jgi:hypothetical protein
MLYAGKSRFLRARDIEVHGKREDLEIVKNWRASHCTSRREQMESCSGSVTPRKSASILER